MTRLQGHYIYNVYLHDKITNTSIYVYLHDKITTLYIYVRISS